MDLICVADLGMWTPMIVTKVEATNYGVRRADIEALFGESWGVVTSMMCASAETENQAATFTPIGALLGNLTQCLARADPAVRDLADYYRMVNLWGTGSGPQRLWPPTVYSNGVRTGIQNGNLVGGIPWDEWAVGLI